MSSKVNFEHISTLPDDSDCDARGPKDTCHATGEAPSEVGGTILLVCCKAEGHDGKHTDTHRSVEWEINREETT